MTTTVSATTILMTGTTTRAPPTTTTPALIQVVNINMTYYGSIIILVFGIIGCLCNFITFTAPQLRKNSCSFYFLIATVFELFSITFGLISRIASENLGSTLLSTSAPYCKLRAYLVSALPLVATYLVLLSSVDRCLSSSISARLRSFSQMKMAYRAVIAAILLSLASCSHILVSYDLRPRCATMPGPYATFDGLFVVFWLGFLPHLLMLFFGLCTILNVRKTKRRILAQGPTNAPATNRQDKRDRKTDTHLIAMMLVQVGTSSFLIMARMIYYAYFVLAPPLTGYNRLIGSFMMSFTILLYYANYAKSFYIYTLSSHLFRSILKNRVKGAIQKALGRYTPKFLLDGSVNSTEVTAQNTTLRTMAKK